MKFSSNDSTIALPGLTTAIRRAFSAGQDWLTPTEIRDYLKNIGFNFERYKANPLASIHTTLRRMVPHEVESKTLEGRKIYRLKTVEQWRSSFGEVGQWLEQNGVDLKQHVGRVVVVKQKTRRSNAPDKKPSGGKRLTASEAHRPFFAELITAKAGTPKSELTGAFAAIPRELYLGLVPGESLLDVDIYRLPPMTLHCCTRIFSSRWKKSKINNGQPTLHAICFAALNVKQGETVVHIGAGTGYYTAVLAELVGHTGKVIAYEIDESLAQRAARNLADLPNVTLHSRSGSEGLLPNCHAIYINAGSTDPLDIWLDALQPSGRLLFPLTSGVVGEMPGPGGMLLVTRVTGERFDARFLFPRGIYSVHWSTR